MGSDKTMTDGLKSLDNSGSSAPAEGVLRLGLPSDGDLYQPTLAYLEDCGLAVDRPNSRRYTGAIPTLPGVSVIFQRTADIAQKVEEGSVDLGITGLDRFKEYQRDDSDVILLIEGLGYGQCDLVVAAPESWLDVESLEDLADLSVEFRSLGRQLRIATKYPRIVGRFLTARAVNYFTLVQASGTLEAAPAAGYADLIADLSASGATLRENRLKALDGGVVLNSEACLVGNRKSLASSAEALSLARSILEMAEGRQRAGSLYRITANVRGASAEAVGASVLSKPDLAGLLGPTVSRVYNVDAEDWYAVTLVVSKDRLLETVDHLRSSGGRDISTSQVNYLFKERSAAYQNLLDSLASISNGARGSDA